MSDFGSSGGRGGKPVGKASDPRKTTWESWQEQGLPTSRIHRKFGGSRGRIQDAEWVVPRIQRHLKLHPENGGSSEGAGPKIHRTPNTAAAAAPAAAPGAAPAADPNQIAFEQVSTTAPTEGGSEPVKLRPVNPSGDGKAELMVANQVGAKRLEDILAGPMSTATNKAGEAAVTAAIAVVRPAAELIGGLEIKASKVDKAKMEAAKAEVPKVVAAITTLCQTIKTNSLEKAKFATPMKNKQTASFQKPSEEDWKAEYIGKFISEMVKQLRQQNEGMNDMLLDQWVINREKFSPTEHLNEMHETARTAVVDALKARCEEGLPRAQARLTKLKKKKTDLETALAALQSAPVTDPEQIKEALKKAKEAAADERATAAEIQGYIDAGPEIEKGQTGGTGGPMDPSKMQGPGGREDAQTAWANKHRKAKEAIVKLVLANDPLVAEWTGIVKETGDLAVLHDPDQIAGGNGAIEPLPVVKEPTDPNDTDGHEAWREYLAKVKGHLGVRDINSSLGSQWKTRIMDLYTKITTDPDNPEAAYGLRKLNVELKPE